MLEARDGTCDPVEATMIRLVVSALGAFLVVVWLRQVGDVLRRINDRNLLQKFVPAVLAGTWLGILLCQVAYKNTTVSHATILLATAPLFAVPLVRIFYGHAITIRAIVGILIAVCGIYLIAR